MLYLLGLGEVTPASPAGRAGGNGVSAPLNTVAEQVTVRIGDNPATIGFAGLAPGFAGLYQINFQVPLGASGSLALLVGLGEQESQGTVKVPCAMKWNPLATASIGAAGGSVTAGAFRLSAPAGALAATSQLAVEQPEEGHWDGTAYGVSGLPSTLRAPITVSIEVPGEPPSAAATRMVVRREGPDEGELYLPVQVEGNRVTAILPARGSAAKSAWLREAAGDVNLERLIFYCQTGLHFVRSNSGRFDVIYGFARNTANVTDLDEAEARDLAEHLDEAYSRLGEMGFKEAPGRPWLWPAGSSEVEPLQVGVLPSAHELWPEAVDPKLRLIDDLGSVRYSSWNNAPSLRVVTIPQKGWMMFSRVTITVSAAAHALFHAVQNLYDPPATGKPQPWRWMDEATATLFQQTVAEFARWEPGFPQGLEYPDNGSNTREVQKHGTGMEGFLAHLIYEEKDRALFSKLYGTRAALGSVVSPVEALKVMLIDVGQRWRGYCDEWARGHWMDNLQGLFETERGSRELTRAEHARMKDVPFDGGAWEESWSAPDLSAQFYKIRFPQGLKADAKVYVTLESPEAMPLVTAVAHRLTVEQTWSLNYGSIAPRFEVPSLTAGESLWIMVINSLSGSTDRRTPIKLRIVPSRLSRLMQSQVLSAVVYGRFTCSFAAGEPYANCPDRFSLRNTFNTGLTAQDPFPLIWQGNTVSTSGERDDQNGQRDGLSIAMKAEAAPDGQSLVSFSASYERRYRRLKANNRDTESVVETWRLAADRLPHYYETFGSGTSGTDYYDLRGVPPTSLTWVRKVDGVVKGQVTSVTVADPKTEYVTVMFTRLE